MHKPDSLLLLAVEKAYVIGEDAASKGYNLKNDVLLSRPRVALIAAIVAKAEGVKPERRALLVDLGLDRKLLLDGLLALEAPAPAAPEPTLAAILLPLCDAVRYEGQPEPSSVGVEGEE